MNPSTSHLPCTVPIWAPHKEPLPPGLTEEERPFYEQNKKFEKYMGMAMESCPVKTTLAGGAGTFQLPRHLSLSCIPLTNRYPGFGIGAFFSLMSASFAYEDPYLRAQTQAGMNTTQKAGQIFREMGRGMWTSGKSFGKIGALFAGTECIIESVSGWFGSGFRLTAHSR